MVYGAIRTAVFVLIPERRVYPEGTQRKGSCEAFLLPPVCSLLLRSISSLKSLVFSSSSEPSLIRLRWYLAQLRRPQNPTLCLSARLFSNVTPFMSVSAHNAESSNPIPHICIGVRALQKVIYMILR